MKPNRGKLGLGDHVKLLHEGLFLFFWHNLMLRNEHMIQWIIDNMRNVEEADENGFGLLQIASESQLMMIVYDGIHEEHNGLSYCDIGGILGQDAQLLALVVSIANITDPLVLGILLLGGEGQGGKTLSRGQGRRNLLRREVAKGIRIISAEFQNIQKGLATPINIFNITKVHSTSL
jgi:hypothetical protein